MARRALVAGCVKLWDQDVMVDWAEPEPEVDDDEMKKLLEKKEYANSPKEDEGIGSACGSPTDIQSFGHSPPRDNYYTMAPAKLDAMCRKYMWAPPVYTYSKCIDSSRREVVWVGRVELPQVGPPLLAEAQRVGPLHTRPCGSVQRAHLEAAEAALHWIKLLQARLIQSCSPEPAPQQGAPCDPCCTPLYAHPAPPCPYLPCGELSECTTLICSAGDSY